MLLSISLLKIAKRTTRKLWNLFQNTRMVEHTASVAHIANLMRFTEADGSSRGNRFNTARCGLWMLVVLSDEYVCARGTFLVEYCRATRVLLLAAVNLEPAFYVFAVKRVDVAAGNLVYATRHTDRILNVDVLNTF